MKDRSTSDEHTTSNLETQAAEASFVGQTEDHTAPAADVLSEQRKSAVDGRSGFAFVP